MEDYFQPEEISNSSIQTQPHNRQAEEAVLGSVLINPESYYDVGQILDADNFYIIRNRWIWEVFTYLHENRIPIDNLTLTEELDSRGQLEEIGGQAYLDDACQSNTQFTKCPGLRQDCGRNFGSKANACCRK